jgi:hypothetical protein
MADETRGKDVLNTTAAQVLTGLKEYMHQELSLLSSQLAVVVSTESGPPPTLTVSIYGENVPSVRYIGTAPSVGATVVLISDGPYYICLGALAA